MADPTQTRLSELMTKVEFFNQRQLAKNLGVTTDGYCHAMCLDWIWRVLQHQGRSKSMSFRFDDESGSERTARTVRRQMVMHGQLGDKKTALPAKQQEMITTSNVLGQEAARAGNVVKYLAFEPRFRRHRHRGARKALHFPTAQGRKLCDPNQCGNRAVVFTRVSASNLFESVPAKVQPAKPPAPALGLD